MGMNLEEFESLLFDWESGSLESDGVERIREILRNDKEARSHFVQMQMINAAMQLEGDAGLGLPPYDEESSRFQRRPTLFELTTEPQILAASAAARPPERRFRARFWFAGVLSLLVCVLAGWLVYSQFTVDAGGPGEAAVAKDAKTRDASKEATSRGVALVTRLVDITWDSKQPELEVGDALTPGRFAIESGWAQIEFLCGATVIVEGPAELELQSATLARVRSGRMRAQVPPAARGFSLEFDEMKVVDLGTEFALSVSSEGASVHVFDGEVELHRPSHEKRLLSAGQAVLRTAEGSYQETEVAPDSFVDIASLESRARGQQSARYEKWKAWSDGLRRDPRLIAYYAFDQQGGWGRMLTCDIEPTSSELDGAIVGARRVAGRWETKQALEFKQPADRVRVQIPGEYSSLTFACWVKIDSLDRWYNSLFLTDNYNHGEPHWQILDTGQLFFSVRARADDRTRGEHPSGPGHRTVLSSPFWQPSMSGKWLHLATTYDVEAGRTTHFLNGQVLHSETIPAAQLVSTTRIGAASIGNWSTPTRPDAQFAIRNLNGSIDEFAIFSAALSMDEIMEMYENGKP